MTTPRARGSAKGAYTWSFGGGSDASGMTAAGRPISVAVCAQAAAQRIAPAAATARYLKVERMVFPFALSEGPRLRSMAEFSVEHRPSCAQNVCLCIGANHPHSTFHLRVLAMHADRTACGVG